MMKRMLLASVGMLMIAPPDLTQNSSSPTAGEPRPFTLPPSTNDRRPPVSPAVSKKRQEDPTASAPVDAIVISEDGMASRLIVKTGGVMGIGGKSVAVVWREVADLVESGIATLPLTKSRLEGASAFTTKEERATGNSALPRLPAS
ncbi:MAG: hypothetical protein RBS99_01705 [Rhodospirillales bacterium]|jgi:hypothetical protein|nr:hypothetical protein [Rhodospirillales bacterium]